MQYLAKEHIETKEGISFNFGGDWPVAHTHDYWEFILITGPCTHVINNKKISVFKSNALIVKPTDMHKFTDSTSTINQINIKITDENLRQITASYDKNLYAFLKETNYPITLELSAFEYDTIYKNAQSALLNDDRLNAALQLRMSIHYILNHFILSTYTVSNTTQKYSLLTQRIIEKLSLFENFSLPITTLLRDFDFSYMQLYRIFKKETGYTLSDYFLYAKMNYANNLLLNSTDSIASIAQVLGYATQSHFTKSFKNYFGYTPTQYRNFPNNPKKDKAKLNT